MDLIVRIWDAETGTQLKILEGHSYLIYSISFSPDGTKIASGAGDYTLRIWDVETEELLKRVDGFDLSVVCVAFSPDGKTVASGIRDSP